MAYSSMNFGRPPVRGPSKIPVIIKEGPDVEAGIVFVILYTPGVLVAGVITPLTELIDKVPIPPMGE